MSQPCAPRIVVIGSINLDLVYHVARLPQPGETLTGTSFQQVHGGKGANQAVAAARLNADVSLIGRIGDDAFGAALIAGLREEAVDVSHVETSVGTSSGLAVIGVEDSGQNCIIVIPGANGLVTSADVMVLNPSSQPPTFCCCNWRSLWRQSSPQSGLPGNTKS